MVIVAFDPNNENVIRQVYVLPKDVSHEDAETTITQAYEEAYETSGDAIEILEGKGYRLASWFGVEVDDA